MKTSEFLKHLKRTIAIIEAVGNAQAANNFHCLISLFEGQGNKQVAKVLDNFADLKIVEDMAAPTINSLLPVMYAINNLLQQCAISSVKNDVAKFTQFLESYKDYSVKAVVLAARSASQSARKKPKKSSIKQGRSVDKADIKRITERLKEAIGHPGAFEKTYEELDIESLPAAQVVEIAKNIDPTTPNRAGKKKAINTIKAFHDDLVRYDKKAKSMSGRSAA